MRINFDFQDLETFLAVMETGSFHAAAGRLNMSQPSVTRRVQKLEDTLGTPLFERTTRSVRPTLAAKRLRVSAEALLDTAAETTRALRDDTQAYAHQRAQVLTIATIPTVLRALLLPALRQVQAAHPALRVRILDLSANAVAEAVAEGDADLGLGSVALQEPALRFDSLFEDPIVLCLPHGHPLAGREVLHWRDLEDEVLILPARGTGNRLLIDDALARASSSVRWRFEVGRTSSALTLVAEGIGVAPLPRIAVTPRVLARRMVTPEILRPIGLITRTSHRITPEQALLRQMLEARAAALSGSTRAPL